VTSSYSETGNLYKHTSVSAGAATEYGGASYGNKANLRNCAGRTSSNSVSFDSSSSVIWVEYNAADGFAVARSDYTSAFAKPYPIWKQGATYNAINALGVGVAATETYPPPVTDNLIVGVAFFQSQASSASDVVYVTSTTKLYASTNAFETAQYATALPVNCDFSSSVGCLRDVKWYVIQQIGVGDSGSTGSVYGYSTPFSPDAYAYKGSEYRGVAPAPRSCSTTGQQFRALGEPEEDA
jgi:hypothetical protein